MDSFVHSFLFEFISVPIDFPPFRAGAKKIDFKNVLFLYRVPDFPTPNIRINFISIMQKLHDEREISRRCFFGKITKIFCQIRNYLQSVCTKVASTVQAHLLVVILIRCNDL